MIQHSFALIQPSFALNCRQSQLSQFQSVSLKTTRPFFAGVQDQSRCEGAQEVVDPMVAERPYGYRFRFLGNLLERFTSEARRNDYEFKHLPAPQQWINIAARTHRRLKVLEDQHEKQINRLTDDILHQQRLAVYWQQELDVFLAAQSFNSEDSADPKRVELLMGQPPDSLEIEIDFHQKGLAQAHHDERVLHGRKTELQELFRQQFVEASDSLAILERQFTQMTGKILRNPRKEYRVLLMKDERTPAEEAQFRALAKEIWGESLVTHVADIVFDYD